MPAEMKHQHCSNNTAPVTKCQKLPFEPMKPPVKIYLELVDLNLGLKLTEKCCGNLLVVLPDVRFAQYWVTLRDNIVDKCKY